MKKQGCLSGRIRFNLLFNLIIIVLVAIPFLNNKFTISLQLILSGWFVVFTILYLIHTYRLMKQHDLTSVSKKEYELNFKYIMTTFIYKEPYALISETLKNLSQLNHSKNIILIIGFEERSPNLKETQLLIQENFSTNFQELLLTVHPYNVEGEIPGKCSNCNYVQRFAVEHIRLIDPNNEENYYMTNFDIDTRFQNNYIEIFDKKIQSTKVDERHLIVYQPILFYNWGLDKCCIFVRITSLIRNVLMMGALIPFNINVMSIFGFSMKLMIDGNYTHPAYQMEDIICFIRWTLVSKQLIRIEPIYTATLSGPTSGKNYWDEVSEWARQLRRWTIGAAEVFHYFVIKSRKMKLSFKLVGWVSMYVLYYCIILKGQNILFLSSIIASQVMDDENEAIIFYLKLAPLAIQYICFALIFIINNRSLYMIKHIGGTEQIGIIRNLFHFILAPIIIFIYGCVAFYALMEVAIRGKEVCKHGASKKEVLQEKLNILSVQ
ncbi:hypothetical protein pb186bvf_002583 [Paramecium bursaria]